MDASIWPPVLQAHHVMVNKSGDQNFWRGPIQQEGLSDQEKGSTAVS